MNKLPLEIIQRILSSVDDVNSLRAATLSCRALYAAFAGAEELITTKVVVRQIHWDVLPEALAVEASWNIPNEDDALEKFARYHLSTRSRPFASWRLADALPIIRLHKIVEFLARRLARNALAYGPPQLSRQSSYQPEPTAGELRRIQRALYRFQLYCNMFSHKNTHYQNQQRLFFRYFSTIEHEQLACIQDLLIRVVARPYNDLVGHDVRWGALGSFHYISSSDSIEGQYIISRGLEKIYKIATALFYEERSRLLRDVESVDGDLFRGYRLDEGLVEFVASFLPDETPVRMTFSTLTPGQKAAYIGRPYCDADHCDGIEDIWERACGRIFLDRVINNSMTLKYRLWGYVFWDRERIPENGWQYNCSYATDPLVQSRYAEDRGDMLAQSQEARRRIWHAGGTGWWSFEDKSRVVWSSASADRDRRYGSRPELLTRP
ncbi:hypothetical protein F5Y06DRAFT_25188 [Hypoxylon sp. FL0890]|nr:hypothetical protein F5Y06DRAFT_25188 [Hypoxylon sp. FL0890]